MGAHVQNLARSRTTLVVAFFLLSFAVLSYGQSEAEILLKFKASLSNNAALDNWNPTVGPCNWNESNWEGVLCYNGSIWGLQLENMGLTGTLNIDTLIPLRYLRTISVMSNRFEGPIPEVKKLTALKSLYLSGNAFSGDIPDHAFSGMWYLKKVFLANNKFTGNVPSSLTELPRLLEARLDGNQFNGQIPDFPQEGLKSINFANNQLEGEIPLFLSNMSANMFVGNKNLCGKPLDPCSPNGTPIENSGTSISKPLLILLIIGLILGILAAFFFFVKWRRQKKHLDWSSSIDSNKLPSRATSTRMPQHATVHAKKNDLTKLYFVRDDTERFDLQDLLKASAEVLGSGTFGSSYKAAIESGQAMVVKRYKQMNNAGREDFHEHMRRLGMLEHPNVLPIVAYYYRKEEKLLISEFVENRCLATHLHGNHSDDEEGLDWPTRLKIIKGVTRGLVYLHNQLPTITLPHGHLKSSNVLLNGNFEPLLTDYALRPLFNPDHAHMLMVSYKSPEYTQPGKISRKSDVWCLGILILEVLTGKYPENYLKERFDSSADLATWVNDKVKEKRVSEVFDKEMTGTKNSKGQMINLLKIALRCCEEDSERRMELKEVAEKIEDLKQGGGKSGDDEFHYESDGNGFSPVGTEQDLAFSGIDR
ncbi:hypothetical protein ACFE04_031776 [Oxalis oulophora]